MAADRFSYSGLRSRTRRKAAIKTALEPQAQPIFCSFCLRRSEQVDVMVLGSAAAVCGDCATLHNRIVEEYRGEEKRETAQLGQNESKGAAYRQSYRSEDPR